MSPDRRAAGEFESPLRHSKPLVLQRSRSDFGRFANRLLTADRVSPPNGALQRLRVSYRIQTASRRRRHRTGQDRSRCDSLRADSLKRGRRGCSGSVRIDGPWMISSPPSDTLRRSLARGHRCHQFAAVSAAPASSSSASTRCGNHNVSPVQRPFVFVVGWRDEVVDRQTSPLEEAGGELHGSIVVGSDLIATEFACGGDGTQHGAIDERHRVGVVACEVDVSSGSEMCGSSSV